MRPIDGRRCRRLLALDEREQRDLLNRLLLGVQDLLALLPGTEVTMQEVMVFLAPVAQDRYARRRDAAGRERRTPRQPDLPGL